MYTFLMRMNTIFSTLLTVFNVVAILLALSTAYFEFYTGLPDPVIRVEQPEVLKAWVVPELDEEIVLVNVKLDADFRPLWHWNVKQVFVYVVAEWRTEGRRHESFLYDETVGYDGAPQVTKIGYDQMRPADYQLRGPRGSLIGNDFTVTVRWNIMPHTGLLYQGEAPWASVPFSIPADTEVVTKSLRR